MDNHRTGYGLYRLIYFIHRRHQSLIIHIEIRPVYPIVFYQVHSLPEKNPGIHNIFTADFGYQRARAGGSIINLIETRLKKDGSI
jgi:hypothetical protein